MRCCCLLAIMSSDAMNVSVQIFLLRPCSQLFGYRTGGEITDHMVILFLILCCCSVAKSFLTLCDPMDCSLQGSSILHYLPEFAHIHVH